MPTIQTRRDFGPAVITFIRSTFLSTLRSVILCCTACSFIGQAQAQALSREHIDDWLKTWAPATSSMLRKGSTGA
jgi:hypothetical protein